MALLLIDLDRFREYNDTFGHRQGDAILREIGARVRGTLGPTDLLARLGGDEFAIVLTHDGPAALAQAQRIAAAIAAPLEVAGLRLHLDASIGIAMSRSYGTGGHALLQCAERAMYAAKREHGTVTFYGDEYNTSNATRLAMAADLRRGLAEGQFVLYYQPLVELATAG